MKYLKVKHYVNVLFREGTKWEYKEILEKKGQEISNTTIRKFSWKKRRIIIVIASIFSYFIRTGFSAEFIGYIIAALSIFIGLFTNLIIVLYQRYSALPNGVANKTKNPNDLEEINLAKIKDFIRQFTFVTGKNLFIATLIIFFATFTLLFKTYFANDTSKYQFVSSLKDIDVTAGCKFLLCSTLYIHKIAIAYLLIDFFLLLLYSLGALFAFLKGEYTQK